MDKVYTRFQTKPAKKPDPMGRRMPSLYKGVPRQVADRMWKLMHTPVADRDLQISEWAGGGGVGGGYPDSEIRGARWSQNKYFSALRASFWSKNKGGAWLPGPSPGSAMPTVRDLDRKWLGYWQRLLVT